MLSRADRLCAGWGGSEFSTAGSHNNQICAVSLIAGNTHLVRLRAAMTSAGLAAVISVSRPASSPAYRDVLAAYAAFTHDTEGGFIRGRPEPRQAVPLRRARAAHPRPGPPPARRAGQDDHQSAAPQARRPARHRDHPRYRLPHRRPVPVSSSLSVTSLAPELDCDRDQQQDRPVGRRRGGGSPTPGGGSNASSQGWGYRRHRGTR